MMSTAPKAIILREAFEGGLKYALYSNFSRYIDAFLELSDNSVGNRIPGKPLRLYIYITPKKIEISNYGGFGMNLNDLKDFLKWGKIKDRRLSDLGAYSQGGKAAMGYLGREMRVEVSPQGKRVKYVIEDTNLHDYRLKEYRVKTEETQSAEGFVYIEISGLKRKVRDEELQKVMADTYRPLIESGEARIEYNGVRLKTEKFNVEELSVSKFSFPVKYGDNGFNKVEGWIGYLTPKSGLKGGMRCYKKGRLICDREYFGHPDAHYKQTLNFLFGEVHLNHVPVTTNKTDFDRDSGAWEEAEEKMWGIMKPFVDTLLGREIEEPTEEERESVKRAQNIFAEIMKKWDKQLKGPGIMNDVSFGQKPSTTKEMARVSSLPTGRINQPRTPPPKNAIGKRRRLKEFMKWNIRAMDEKIRSVIEEKNGEKTLVINKLYPGFKASKRNDLYLLETAAIQVTKPDPEEKITIEEYISGFDELFAFICENFDLAKENLKKKKIS